MTKKKVVDDEGNVLPEGEGVAEQVAVPGVVAVTVLRITVLRIESESDAIEQVKSLIESIGSNYKGDLIVTEDGNIFNDQNFHHAMNHAYKQGQKHFRITWP